MSRAKLVELHNRDVKVVNSDNIYTNGSDNNYPERIKRVINNSVNAKACATVLADFFIGKGFNVDNDLIINKSKGLTLLDCGISASEDVSVQKGFWLHVNFNLDATERTLDVLPYEFCRRSKKDHFGYEGLIQYCKEWNSVDDTLKFFFQDEKSKVKKDFFYPFNDDIDIINQQRRNDWKLANPDSKKEPTVEELVMGYRGQVLFINLEPRSIYPLSYFDAAYNAADTEFRLSTLINNKVRTGFIDATVMAVRKNSGEDEGAITSEDAKSLLGAENQSQLLFVEVQLDDQQKLEDAIHTDTISSPIDTDLIETVAESAKQEILTACKRIPKVLVESGDGALFGANAETLEKARTFFNDQTSRERTIIANGFNRALGRKDLKIIELGNDSNTLEDAGDITD